MSTMSFLFSKKSKKIVKWVWIFLSIVIILSMVFFFAGGTGTIF